MDTVPSTVMNLIDWALKWGISREAIADFKHQVGLDGDLANSNATTESGAQQRVRLEAASLGIMLWRNNVGATMDQNDRLIRYGLANDSKAMNTRIKSADLIGIRPDGQFVSREIKKPGWRYTGTPREEAQLRWANLILASGGDAAFATGEGTL